jgi:hypothetical protein
MTRRSIEKLIARRLGRRAFLRAALGSATAGGAWYALGCGDGNGGESTATAVSTSGAATPASTAAAGGEISPRILGSEFVAGQDNRFPVGLLRGSELVRDADVHLRFFTIGADGTTGTFRGEGDAQFVELNLTEDGRAATSDDSVAFYVVNAPFDAPGRWGVEIAVTPAEGGAPSALQAAFVVSPEPITPGIGSTPPASTNDTAATYAGADPEGLCSRDPRCDLHDVVIADVLGGGRPLVVQFSTPAFCETRFCGPVLDVLLQQVPQYRDRIDFVHIEVWQDFQLRQARPAMLEWGLQTEPYTFFMAPDGRVVAKLESVFSEEELSSALEQLAAI